MYTLSSIADTVIKEFNVKYISVIEDGFKITFRFKKRDYKKITDEKITTFEYKCRPMGVYFTYEEEKSWIAKTSTAFGTCLTNAVRTVKNGLMKLLRMN